MLHRNRLRGIPQTRRTDREARRLAGTNNGQFTRRHACRNGYYLAERLDASVYDTAFYSECVQTSKKTGEPNAIWRKMPSFMVRKVAIAQAFRLCFSDEFGGMPYTNDEMGVDAPKERDITHEATATIADEAPSAEIKNEPKPANAARQLETLLTKYESQLSGKPYGLAVEALCTGSDAEVIAMYERVVSYLKRKGIQVGK